MTALVVHPAVKPLTGSVPVVPDPSIAQRALLLGALSQGRTRLTGYARAGDTVAMAECLRALGARVDAAAPSELAVIGNGLDGLREPADILGCRASSTTLGLLGAVLAAAPFRATLAGDAALSMRSLARIVAPLRARGAVIAGTRDPRREGEVFAPLVVGPLVTGRRLTGLQYESATPSAQVKSAVLLSGLYAGGPTLFKEPSVSPDHTERMLGMLGVPVRTVGPLVQLDLDAWDRRVPAFELAIPGDLAAAAVLVVAAHVVEGSRVSVRGVGTNPTRSGFLEMARDMGAGLALEPQGEHGGEPVALVHAWHASLRAIAVGGETIARSVDDLPAACALATRAAGTTRIADAEAWGEGIGATARMLRAFGVVCEERLDGLVVEGRDGPLEGAEVESAGDARIAMAAAVLGLGGRTPTRIRDAACIGDVFPKFVATLRALGARVDIA